MGVAPPREREAGIGRLAAAVRRRRVLVLVTVLAFAGAAVALARLMPPVYRAEAQIVIEGPAASGTRSAGAPASGEGPEADDAVSRLASDAILGAVAERLDLAGRPEYAPGRSPLDRLFGRPAPAARLASGEVTARMRQRLAVSREANARVLVVAFASSDPALARDVPNAIAAHYLARPEDTAASRASEAAGRLTREIADRRRAVAAAEERLAAARAAPDRPAGRPGLAEARLADAASDLARTQAARAEAERRAQAIREAPTSGRPPGAVADDLADPGMSALGERRAALRARISDLSATLLDNHPRMRSLRADLRALDAEAAREAKRRLASLETEADAAREREAALSSEVERLKGEAASASAAEADLRALEREADAQNRLLQADLARSGETPLAADPLADARIVSEARLPTGPEVPRTGLLVATAAVAGLLVAVLGIAVAELLPGRALRPAPAAGGRARPMATSGAAASERFAAVPDTGGVPAPGLAAPAVARPADLVEAMIAAGIPRVVVTAAGAGHDAGALVLARALAARGAGTVLVDLDGGAMLARMGLDPDAPGLSDLGRGGIGFAEILHRDRSSAVDAIGSGSADLADADLADADLLEAYAMLEAAYDVTVVACGALSAERLSGIVDDKAALVVSLAPGERPAASARLAVLKAAGHADVLLMASTEGAGEAGASHAA